MIVLGAVFIVIPTIFVGLRVWARFLSRACLSWDDYTVFLALVCVNFSSLITQISDFVRYSTMHAAFSNWLQPSMAS